MNNTRSILNTTNKIKLNENDQNLLITAILQSVLNHGGFWKLNHQKTKKGTRKHKKKDNGEAQCTLKLDL